MCWGNSFLGKKIWRKCLTGAITVCYYRGKNRGGEGLENKWRVSGEEMMKMAGRVYQEYYKGSGVSREDLVSEGVVGILVGMSKFDESKGVQLSTYMYVCARNAMAGYVRKEKVSRKLHGDDLLVGVEAVGEDVVGMLAEREESEELIEKVREAAGVMRPKVNAIANELLKGRRQVDVARQFNVSRQAVNNIFKKIRVSVVEKYEYDGVRIKEKEVKGYAEKY